MRLTLVAMPWPYADMPSAAIGSLAAFVRAREPRVAVRSSSEYVRLWSRIPNEYDEISQSAILGELIYAMLLYPERKEPLVRSLSTTLEAERRVRGEVSACAIDVESLDRIVSATAHHLDEAGGRLARDCDVVGLTTSYAQLFASLCLARLLKHENPAITVALGGAGADAAGASLLDEFPFVDFVIKGEGEVRLVRLLRALLDGETPPDDGSGVISRMRNVVAGGAAVNRCDEEPVHNIGKAPAEIEALPYPDFDEYFALAGKRGLAGVLPIEGSRGCWWDRRVKSRNPMSACYFCGFNGRTVRRDKSTARIAVELRYMSERYQVSRFRFVDNVIREGIGAELAGALREHDRRYEFFAELRATVRPLELLRLKEAGCTEVQVGVEGLSTRYLKRLNKGTTTIQNLCAMRACFELEIPNGGNLLIAFPGATQEEVDETRRNILGYAIAYQPLRISEYGVVPDSPVARFPERFRVRIRKADVFAQALPAGPGSSLSIPWLDHEVDGEDADWAPVLDAWLEWRNLHESIPAVHGTRKPLLYFEGDSFIAILDLRAGKRTIVLDQLESELYLYCTEIRSRREIVEWSRRRESGSERIDSVLGFFLAERLMFEENGKYLSLAVAATPEIASRRMLGRLARQESIQEP
ncbi:MAG: RiPP maturation radical SAM C-methyltransferase [Acidobacteriota bacterium]